MRMPSRFWADILMACLFSIYSLLELAKERKAQRLTRPVKDRIFSEDKQRCRWSYFKNLTDSEELLRIVRDEAFPFIKTLGGEAGDNAYTHHMKDAVFLIANPALL